MTDTLDTMTDAELTEIIATLMEEKPDPREGVGSVVSPLGWWACDWAEVWTPALDPLRNAADLERVEARMYEMGWSYLNVVTSKVSARAIFDCEAYGVDARVVHDGTKEDRARAKRLAIVKAAIRAMRKEAGDGE